MGRIDSDVTVKHKVVKVSTYQAYERSPTYKLSPIHNKRYIVFGERQLFDEMSTNYKLQGGSVESGGLPLIMSFNAYYSYYSMGVLLFGINDEISGEGKKTFTVFAPRQITNHMNYSFPIATIETCPPSSDDLSLGLPKL